MDNIELWDTLIDQARLAVLMEHSVNPHDAQMIPPTGPSELDTTKEITKQLARLVVLLVYQKARVEQMELTGHHYNLVRSWTKQTEEMVESLGLASVGIGRRLAQLGYSTMPK